MIRDIWREAMANGGWPAIIRDAIGLIVILAAVLAMTVVGSTFVS